VWFFSARLFPNLSLKIDMFNVEPLACFVNKRAQL